MRFERAFNLAVLAALVDDGVDGHDFGYGHPNPDSELASFRVHDLIANELLDSESKRLVFGPSEDRRVRPKV